MRRPTLASALVILVAAPAFAQPVQSLARVKVGSASLYSGPGEAMPKCGSVEQGYVVVVDHTEGNDWLAIQPPPQPPRPSILRRPARIPSRLGVSISGGRNGILRTRVR